MATNPVDTEAGRALAVHHEQIAKLHLRELLQQPGRIDDLTLQVADLVVDLTRARVDSSTLDLLAAFADELGIPDRLAAMVRGDVVNTTERRPALHTATRLPAGSSLLVDGQDVAAEVEAVNAKASAFADSVHSGHRHGANGQPIRSIVNIGIGGSDLGPRMVARALRRYWQPNIEAFFVSNVDPSDLDAVLTKVDPATTLFVVVSKSFTTVETLANAEVARRWLIEALGEAAVSKHMVAVTAATSSAVTFGISPDEVFAMWDWVGGRFSLSSAVGLAIELTIGSANMAALRAGMHTVDRELLQQPSRANAAVMMGALDVWYANYFDVRSKAVVPYSQELELLPAHLQQLQMESNGKSVTIDGERVDWNTSPSLWGAPGTNGQHAFFQLLHQGTDLIPLDLIGVIHHDDDERARLLQSNLLAQASALAIGRSAEELAGDSVNPHLIPHREMRGNHPSTLILLPRMDPTCLGQLIALYEHSTVVAGLLWGINPFDQWGVELGKQRATNLLPAFSGATLPPGTDPATAATMARLRGPSA